MRNFVRIATNNDIDALYDIYSHKSVAPNMGFDPCSRDEFEEIFSELMSGGEVLVNEFEGDVVAVCKVIRRAHRLRHSAYIGSLAVHCSHQDKGHGKEFFDNIIHQLKSEGLTRLELLVGTDNHKAINFFKAFGFVTEGTHKNYFSRQGSNQLFNEHTMAWVKNT